MFHKGSKMKSDAKKGIKPLRQKALPADLRRALKEARKKHRWSQRDLSSRVGFAQRHISGIESGKIVPRYDTVLEIVRVLGHDLLMVPRALVPAVQSLIRDYKHGEQGGHEERALYADTGEEEKLKDGPVDEV
jgi:transcriptional regulator with XRE-family HTH domain